MKEPNMFHNYETEKITMPFSAMLDYSQPDEPVSGWVAWLKTSVISATAVPAAS